MTFNEEIDKIDTVRAYHVSAFTPLIASRAFTDGTNSVFSERPRLLR